MSFGPIEDGGCIHIWTIITTSSQSLTTVSLQICQECVPAIQSASQLPAQKEQDEEGDPGKEAGEEGSKDPLSYSPGFHPDLDSLQCSCCYEGNPWA